MINLSDNNQNVQNNVSPEVDFSEQKRIRIEKLEALCAEGHNPYELVKYPVDNDSVNIKSNFDALEGKTVVVAGRLMSKRIMGKASFCDIQDGKGRIQSYVSRDEIGEEEYAAFKKLDIGDIIGITGMVFKTKVGEISIHATELILLSKSLNVLPEKFHGLKDQEMRYRQRYVDLIVNPEVKDTFIKRSQIIKEIRNFLDNRGYLEVDTPVLHTLEIGAAARPFVTHHNTLDIDMYLRIETELYLKRLIVGGFDKVYEVGRIFRNEGMDVKHNPEFTSIEMYEAYTDYHGMMDLVEELYTMLTKKVCGKEVITYQGTEINMASPWKRLTMAESVKLYAGVDYYDWKTDEEARACAKEHHVEVEDNATRGKVLAEFFDAYVEDKLIQPTFIYDYPVEISPLAKRKASEPEFTERFEFFIYAREMGNAFSELNDPIDQRKRFEKQVAEKRAQGANAQVDEDFINALEYGMPPTGGLGIGVDRLVMLLTDSYSIRDVLLFPTMRPLDVVKNDNNNA
ncbi:MAG: lysine--tRNA ligase [Clostridiales bacterium]|nr:lysine--tRNA ligase [Clostridiales bacterium]